MDIRSRYPDFDEVIETHLDALQSRMRTAIPVMVSEDSSDGHTVKLQPLVKAVRKMPDGTQKFMDLPPISDVPINHHGGGGVTVTHPHKKGDEGIILLSDRSIDAWHQQGGSQQQMHARMHNLSDGFYIPGVRSDPRKLKNVSTKSTQMRSDDGMHFTDLNPTDGTITHSVDGGKHTMSMSKASGIAMKTSMALAVDASKGTTFKGMAHFDDAVTSKKSFTAPNLNGQVGGGFTGIANGLIGALIGAGLMMAMNHAMRPSDGIQQARYVLTDVRHP